MRTSRKASDLVRYRTKDRREDQDTDRELNWHLKYANPHQNGSNTTGQEGEE